LTVEGAVDRPRGRNDFGDALRQLRLQSRLTQEALAERAGLSVRTIRGMESGRILHPHSNSISRLADALRLDGGERVDFTALARSGYWTFRVLEARPTAELRCHCGETYYIHTR
jgi:transcriptional regulator with XRE-family HTH domain